jgi:hypothetical protein
VNGARAASRVPPALAVLVLGAACGRVAPAGKVPAATPARTAALAAVLCDRPRIRVEVLEVARTSPEALSVRLMLTNPDAASPVAVGQAFADGEGDGDGSLSGAFVVDEDGGRKVFVLRDLHGRPSCSTVPGPVPAGGHVEAWARYPVPRAGVARITLQVPGAPPLRGLPVTAPADGTARPGPSY